MVSCVNGAAVSQCLGRRWCVWWRRCCFLKSGGRRCRSCVLVCVRFPPTIIVDDHVPTAVCSRPTIEVLVLLTCIVWVPGPPSSRCTTCVCVLCGVSWVCDTGRSDGRRGAEKLPAAVEEGGQGQLGDTRQERGRPARTEGTLEARSAAKPGLNGQSKSVVLSLMPMLTLLEDVAVHRVMGLSSSLCPYNRSQGLPATSCKCGRHDARLVPTPAFFLVYLVHTLLCLCLT